MSELQIKSLFNIVVHMMNGQNHILSAEVEGKYEQFFPSFPLLKELPLTGNKVFDYAIQPVFFHEGIFSDDPDDNGGATAWGWSLRTAMSIGDLDGDDFVEFDFDFDGDVDVQDMLLLKDNPQKAVELYKMLYWDKYNYGLLPEIVAIKTFDFAVNMGAKQAHKLLQRSVRAAGNDRLVDDGVIGKNTLKTVNLQDPDCLVAALRSHAAGFYNHLAYIRPKSRKYLGGWLNRAYF